MSIEAMKQALAKFESLWEIGIDAVYRVELLPEIQALRQAIEEAEKQEPVAWMVRDSIDGSWYPCAFENPAGAIKGESKPLYAVPQQAEKQELVDIHCPSCLHSFVVMPVAKREWVGLNWDDIPDVFVGDIAFMQGARWAEAKLKEKNGG
jgi:hypothetical protein